MLPTSAVEAILKGHVSDQASWDSPWCQWTYPGQEDVEVPGLGRVEVIEVYELGEGDYGGEEWIIFRITFEDGTVKHYKKFGHYQSFEYESGWDDRPFKEVTKKVVTVPAYERIEYS